MKINAVCKTPDPEGRRKVLQAIYDKHGTYEKCAKSCKVSKHTFWDWCVRYDVRTVPEYKKERPEMVGTRGPSTDWGAIKRRMGYVSLKALITYCRKHYTYKEAADKLTVSTRTYYNVLKYYGMINDESQHYRG